MRCASPPALKGRKFIEVSAKELKCMITQACPSGCLCWELPSENLIKMDCNSLELGETDGKSNLKGFMDVHEPLEFEVDLSGRKLWSISDSFVKDVSIQMRLVNLTRTELSSIDFLDKLDNNNVTKFALSKNPFQCGGCEFQKMWWKHYKRIVDIREVTCVSQATSVGESEKSGLSTTSSPQLISFYDLVKSSVCTEEAISDEIRFLMISLGVLVPLIIVLLVCCGRQQRERDRTLNKKQSQSIETASIHAQRSYSPTRSKVADMDNSKF
jgi:hypothetical protein